MVAPPMPYLKSFTVYGIDPMCYADDISLLLLGSKQLEDLRIVWSPRMREQREPSVNLHSYFGRCMAAGYQIQLKRVTIKNLFTYNDGSCGQSHNLSKVEEVTIINSTSGSGDDGGTIFIDNSIMQKPTPKPMVSLKSLRTDKVSKELVGFLSFHKGLEKLYFIGPQKYDKTSNVPRSPTSNSSSPRGEMRSDGLKDDMIEAISRNHGETLRHLLLPPQWRLSADNIALLIRSCRNLEQIGLGVDFDQFMNMRLLVPFLPKLKTLRLLDNPESSDFREKMHEQDDGNHEEHIGNETSVNECSVLRYIEIADLVFETGKVELTEDPEDPRKKSFKRKVWRRTREEVNHLEIWRMDSFDIDV